MHHSNDNNKSIEDSVVYCKGKLTDQCSASIPMNNRIHKWIILNRIQRFINFIQEFMSETKKLLFIPYRCIFDIRLGFFSESHYMLHSFSRTLSMTILASVP